MIGPFYILLSIKGIKHCIKLNVRNQCHCLCGDDLDIDPGVGSWRHFEVFTNWNFNENVFAVATSTQHFPVVCTSDVENIYCKSIFDSNINRFAAIFDRKV